MGNKQTFVIEPPRIQFLEMSGCLATISWISIDKLLLGFRSNKVVFHWTTLCGRDRL